MVKLLQEKKEIFNKTVKYKVMTVVQLLQIKMNQRKNEAFNELKNPYLQYKEELKYQKQFSAAQTISDKMRKYASIVETCQKINRKYEEFCHSVNNNFPLYTFSSQRRTHLIMKMTQVST